MDVRSSHRLFDTTFLPFTFLFVAALLCTRYLMNDDDDPQRPVALLVFLRCPFRVNALGIRVNSLPLANLLVTGCRAPSVCLTANWKLGHLRVEREPRTTGKSCARALPKASGPALSHADETSHCQETSRDMSTSRTHIRVTGGARMVPSEYELQRPGQARKL